MPNVFDNSYKITYMVGNGFDLGCGLKSRFDDTYKIYVEDRSNDNKTISDFKDNITRHISSVAQNRTSQDINWSDFEMGMAKYAEELSSEAEFVECVRNYSLFLTDYLRNEETSFFEHYNKRELIDIKTRNSHISDSVLCYSKGLNNNDIEVLRNETNNHTFCSVNIISFNYTSIFETLLKNTIVEQRINRLPVNFADTVHIHGNLQNGIVLGVDNIAQFGNLKYKLSEMGELCFIKPTLNNAFDKQRVAKTNNIIQSSDLICIVGMSLGDSDWTWRQAISSWLDDSERHHLIYYDFELMLKKGLPPFDILMTEKDKKTEFLKKLPITADVSNQIHFPIGNWFFNIIHVIYEKKEAPETPLILN